MTANLIDTNILVYANNEDSQFHSICKSKVIAPTSQTIDTVARLIEKHSPKSQSIFDYLLAATMLDNGVHGIYTANSEHFEHFDSIKVTNPLSK
ncbi:MAG: hypothetical protein Q8O60_04980 [Deltaproteobacteria bacterium]|nr:hypothetical protein [Deltaproteobacteria bacterium]